MGGPGERGTGEEVALGQGRYSKQVIGAQGGHCSGGWAPERAGVGGKAAIGV